MGIGEKCKRRADGESTRGTRGRGMKDRGAAGLDVVGVAVVVVVVVGGSWPVGANVGWGWEMAMRFTRQG
jgi:hypothetical protein